MPAVVLFDIRFAFPSVSWEWMWTVLRRLRVSAWLIVAVRSLYYGSHSDIVFGGCVSERGFPVRRGFLQVCPASGSLWALCFDPVVRALAHAHPEPQGFLTAFADDLASAFVNMMSELDPIMEVFLRLPLATGLHLHIPKVKVVSYSGLTSFDLRRRLLDRLGTHALDVGSTRYVCVPIGPDSSASFWDRVLGKSAHRCAALRASPTHLSTKVTRYAMYCLSVVVLLGQFAPLHRAFFASRRPLSALYARRRCMLSLRSSSRPPDASARPSACGLLSSRAARHRCASHSGRTSWTTSATPSSAPGACP